MNRYQKLVAEFKDANPIRDCLGCTGGRWKWVRYLDGINLRYGHSTKRRAELDRARVAKEHASMTLYNEELVPCDKCSASIKREEYNAMGGVCWQCERKAYPEFYATIEA